MTQFYDQLPLDTAQQIEPLSWLSYQLRENRKALLAHYGVNNAQELLARIESGALDEHPAYEHYLSLFILEQQRDATREQLRLVLAGNEEQTHAASAS
ncbi:MULTISPECIES: hypothetical protein [Aquitalea]|uniref:hypothetical protein n=1 Tax=Aquitalea TaxID=407217 RepID=UPI0013597162|nr:MULTISPECIES: hypothetical protein [Aquitalea]